MRTFPIILFFFVAVLFADDRAPLPGTYSDLAYNQDSDHLYGTEIKIVYSMNSFFIVLHCASGVPIVRPLLIEGQAIQFELSLEREDDIALCGTGTFHGRIEKSGIYLSKLDSKKANEQFLPRTESYWNKRNRVAEKSKKETN